MSDIVKEAFMAGHYQQSWKVQMEPCHGTEVQLIRGCIQQQKHGLHKNCPGQGDTATSGNFSVAQSCISGWNRRPLCIWASVALSPA